MATRNRSTMFNQFKTEKKEFKYHSPKVVAPSTIPTILGQTGTDGGHVALDVGVVPPDWLGSIEDVNYQIDLIKEDLEKLTQLHKKHLVPQFSDDQTEEEQLIQILTEKITTTFHSAQTNIQKIGLHVRGSQEEKMKKNIQSALAIRLQDLSVVFRKSQKDYLKRIEGRKHKVSANSDEDEQSTYDPGFTKEQVSILDTISVHQTQRDQDIQKIVKSITELASIFKDLSTLVIEQGTILDRIDYNIDVVSHSVEEGVKELGKASESQKSYRKKLCMLLLCLGILIVLVVMIIKGLIPTK